ncbi:hypothetical protein LN042_27980 [Kitasatospora sp. RB6PN24]|uniref:hypothetical protein n=1 Tax=Kitasatospora humi TaxID=2893891 RepID=UPI001E6060E8|nr:hypothetical protein [Kitasatospora humi]MCC9310864.1 hypothetical protein [Kitasatospora humi]
MDPVSVGLLVALAGGAGGEMGKQAWSGLSALVRRPFHRGDNSPAEGFSSGEGELALLNQAPDSVERAQALSTALAVRAALDSEFRTELDAWHTRARPVLEQPRVRDVHNEIKDGHYEGFVIQAGNIDKINQYYTQPPAQAD